MIWSIQPHSAAAVTISGSLAVVAAQAAEPDLARFLELLERRLDVGIAEQRDLAAVDAVEVVAVDVVGPEPLQARVQAASRKSANARGPPTLPRLFLVTR